MAYNITENYKQVIYSGDARNKIKILFNNVELQEADRYCERATIKSRILPNGAKRFSLNNFISKEVEIILHDIDTSIIQDKVSISIGTLVGSSYEYVPIGIFNIQGTPTTDKNKITIKLRDNSVKFDFNYNAKPLIDEKGGSATKLQILQDICSKANVTCNITSFLGSTDSIGIYDNTITARQYIADIAEQAGRIATINRNGELIFVNLNSLTTWNIPLSIVEKYEIGKAYRIGKVVYEDAIRKYETASTNYDTLYLDSSNPYISSQSQVNSILQQVNNFAIDSVKTGKILGNPAIDGYDIINIYNDKVEGNPSVFKTLATNELVYTGVLINTFDTQIGEEERKENVSIVGEATFKKWATTSINNINGEIDIQAGKIDNVEKEINPTQDASGSSIYLEDSTDAELVNFEMEGKTTQETSTQGKNLFDENYYRNATYTNNVYRYTLSKIKGGRRLYVKAKLKEGKSAVSGIYVCLSTNPNPNTSGSQFQWFINNGNTPNGSFNPETFTDYLYFSFYPTTTTLSQILDNYNLWVSTDNINYEPFIPDMPSPDYPSELVSVGYKNYLYHNQLPSTKANVTVNYDSNDNTYSLNGTANANWNLYILSYTTSIIHLEAGESVTYTIKRVSGTSKVRFLTYFVPDDGSTMITNWDVILNANADYNIATRTATKAGKIAYVQFWIDNGITYDSKVQIMVTKGTQEHSYIPYGKYGIEVVSQGANYFDASKIKNSNISVSNDGKTITMPIATSGNGLTGTGAKLKDLAPKLQAGDKVYLYFERNGEAYNRYIYLYGSNFVWVIGNARTITQEDLDGNVGLYGNRYTSGETEQVTLTDFRIVKQQNTPWEQFKSQTFLYTLNQPLRGIGDTKDLLYIKNGILYVDRKIGSIVLDGTQSISLVNWRPSDTSTGWIYSYNTTKNLIPQAGTTGKIMSTQLSPTSYGNLYAQSIDDGIALYNNNAYGIVIRTSDTSLTTKALVNNYLSQHPMIVDYALAEPTTEELGQVDIPNTYKTITHIDTIDINEPNMNITYVRDTQLTNYVEQHISQIIVNEEGISSRVQTIEDSDYNSRLNAVEQKQTDTDLTIDIISTNIDKTNGNIREVTTTTGFTFNAEGMTIEDSSSQFKAQHRIDGTYYKDGDTIVGQYTKDGSKQKDLSLFGVYYYGMNDIDDTPMFVAELYTDNNGEEGFGHFPNRGD